MAHVCILSSYIIIMQTIIIQSFFKMSTLLNRVGNMTFQHITEKPTLTYVWIRSNFTTKCLHWFRFFILNFLRIYIQTDKEAQFRILNHMPKNHCLFLSYLNITFYLLQSLRRKLIIEKPRMSNELTWYDSK